MTRKKKTPSSEKTQSATNISTPQDQTQPQIRATSSPASAPSSAASSSAPPNPWFGSKQKNGEPSTSALIICRNKHWRYISSFHGPWLQLPPEVLESLAHSNYANPRPRPIDPAVFYDLVKIRKAVDEATNIAVRAASGVTSAALNASLSANNGMLNSAGAAALGLGFGGTGATAKLSRERKHRMREQATQKLSQAYHLDEIAASVATMQSASTLEDLAMHVLQRNQMDYDARYVHFFHEKIPSRMMADYTPLDPLNALISEKPHDGSAFRTRALTRIFKDDYAGAARDLTEGLSVARWLISQHRAGKDQLVLASEAAKQRSGRDWRNEVQIPEEDQPSSLEVQLLFHRANVYLSIACQHVHDALDAYWDEKAAKDEAGAHDTMESSQTSETIGNIDDPFRGTAEKLAHKRHLEYRRMVKSNARKALKDYMEFLKHFDYTPGTPPEIAEEFVRRFNAATSTESTVRTRNIDGAKVTTSRFTVDFKDSSETEDTPLDAQTGALVPARKPRQSPVEPESSLWPPTPEIYEASQLFQEKIPASIPPYPNPQAALTVRSGPTSAQMHSSEAASAALASSAESITYHPLLTDSLHSLLLCHALLQTSPTELKRHAHNAARLARICDGYPIFLAARSPARADWVEILRRANNWISLNQSWETLCRPAPLPGHGTQGLGDRGWNLGKEPETPSAAAEVDKKVRKEKSKEAKEESEKMKTERRKHEAILDALADERVVDEASFQRAVRAREKRAIEDEEGTIPSSRTLPTPSPTPEPVSSEANTSTISANEQPMAGPSPVSQSSSAPAGSENVPAKSNGTTKKSSTPPSSTPKPSKKSAANGPTNGSHKRWAQDESKDYPISTERADAISRWVREAPLTVEGASKSKKKKSGAGKKVGSATAGADRVEEEIDE